MRKHLRKRTNKKGAYSIITVMLALIMVVSFQAYSDIMNKSFVLNEVQQRLDTAGLNALNESIDTSQLRMEELALDENNRIGRHGGVTTNFRNKIDRAYREQVFQTIRTNDVLKRVSILRTDVTMENSAFGTGQDMRTFPQLTLSSIVYLEVKKSDQFDLGRTTSQDFYDARSGNNFSITVVGTNDPTTTGMLVRSSTRVVYR